MFSTAGVNGIIEDIQVYLGLAIFTEAKLNYVVLDLEWNQCPGGKEKEEKELPFEIIEIGACRLNDDFDVTDDFHRLISPVAYKSLHNVTKTIIKISMEDLNEGVPFSEAVDEFFDWCSPDGEPYVFCTWGSMDLTELQRNCRYFGVKHNFGRPLLYYDIQKLYSIWHDDGKKRDALETATDEQNIEKDIPFHSALCDALYTAKILKKIEFEKVKIFKSIDTYVIPRNRKEEFTINYGTYSKFISRGFTERDDVMKDSSVNSTKCYLCGKNARKKIRWFSSNQKSHYCLAVCEEHGFLKGRIKIKRADNGMYYASKVLKLTDENGAKAVRDRQLSAREKRRIRRQKEKEKQ